MTRGILVRSTPRLMVHLRSSTALLIGLLAVAPMSVHAEDLTWTAKNNGDFDGNWNFDNNRWQDDDGDPDDFDPGDSAIFNNPDPNESYQVNINQGGNSFAVVADNVTFNATGVTIAARNSRSLVVNGNITVVEDAGTPGREIGTITAPISGVSGFTKLGEGRLDLGGANTNTGTITIDEGRINVTADGSLDNVAGVIVNDGTVLGGSGDIGGPITVNGAGELTNTLVIDSTVETVGPNAQLTMSGGSISGLATLAGETTANGVAFNGGVNNTGNFDVAEDTTVGGTFTNDDTILNSDGDTVTMSGMTVFNNNSAINGDDGDGNGTLTISATTINLNDGTDLSGSPAGSLNFTGAVNVNDTVVFQNTGIVTGSIDVDATAAFTNVNGTSVVGNIASLGTVNVDGGTVDSVSINGGQGTFSAGNSTGSIDVGGTLTDTVSSIATFDGDFQLGNGDDDSLTIQGGTASTVTVSVTNDSTLTVAGTVDLLGQAGIQETRLTVDEGSELSTAIGVNVGVGTNLDNSGTISGDGTVTNQGGTITNDTTGVIAADVTNTTGTIENNGDMTGVVLITGGTLTNNGSISGTPDGGGGLNGSVTLNGATAELVTVPVTASTPSQIDVLVTNLDGTITAGGGNFAGGVNNADVMNVTADTEGSVISNTGNGDLNINETATLDANVNQTSGTADTDIDGTLEGVLTLADGTAALNGQVTGSIDLIGENARLTTGAQSDGTTLSVVTQGVTNNGTINANITNFQGGITNEVNGELNVQSDITGNITNEGGPTGLAETGVVDIAGTATVTGNVVNTSGATEQAGTVAGNAETGGGTFNNTGTIEGTLLVDGGSFNNQMGAAVDLAATVSAGILNANGGTFGTSPITVNGSGDLRINENYSIDVAANGGQVNIAATRTLTGDFDQAGSVTNNAGTITDADLVVSGGELNNQFLINGDVTVENGQLDMEALSTVNGSVTVDGGTVNALGGIFGDGEVQVDDGTLNVSAPTAVNVTNAGGQVNLQGVLLTGSIDNQSGDALLSGVVGGNVDVGGNRNDDIVTSTANITGTLGLTGGRFVGNGGLITQQVTNDGGLLHLNGVILTTDVDNLSGETEVLADTTADIENLGGELNIRANQTLTGTVTNTSGDTFVRGTLMGNATVADGVFRTFNEVDGTIMLTGGKLNTRSTTNITGLVTNGGGEINAELGTFQAGVRNNTGEFDVREDVTVNGVGVVNVNGTVFVREDATLTGYLDQRGNSADNSGTIDGIVDVTGGSFTNSGRVIDVVTVSGSGEMTVEAGASFDEEVQSLGGDIFVDGAMTGNFFNDGGALRIREDGDIDGNVELVSNIVNNNGRVQGTVDVIGGTWSQRDGARTAMLTTVGSGGTLNAEGGNFSGGVLMQGGDLNMTGDTVGNFENDGSNIDLPTGVTLTGDFTNTLGNVIVRNTVDGSITIDAGTATFSQSAATTERTIQNAGTVDLNGGTFDDGFTANSGETFVNGAVDAKVRVNGDADVLVRAAGSLTSRMIINNGDVDMRGTADGGITAAGGTLINTGDINAKLILRNDAEVEHNGGNVSGKTVVNGGELTVAGGTFSKDIAISDGTVTFTSNGAADVALTGGTLVLNNNRTLTGDVDNNGRFDLAGTLDGDLENKGTTDFIGDGTLTGQFTNTGTILFNGEESGFSVGKVNLRPALTTGLTPPGAITVIGGTLTNEAGGEVIVAGQSLQVGDLISAGEISVTNDQVLISETTVVLQDGSETIVKDGGLQGVTIDAQSGATLNVQNGDLEGALTVAGDLTSRGSSQLFGDAEITGNGTLTVRGNVFDIDGFLDTRADTTTTIAAGSTLSSNGFTQRGAITMGDGSTIEGLITNLGTIRIDGGGTLNFAGGITGNGRVNVSGNNSTDDRINVGGAGVDGATFALDIDLSKRNGTSDQIVITDGVLTGDVTLDFNLLGEGARQNDPVLVIETNGANTAGFSPTVTGLPDDDGPLVYTLSETGQGFAVTEGLNPAISGLAGSVVLTQSLIGSVINRPSSPFVSGLAIEGEDPCGAGVWARATGGYANSSGNTVDSSLGDRNFSSELELNYGGVQIGGDWACFGGFYNGWDMAFGGIIGANIGEANQPVFGLDGSSETGFSDELKSVTDFKFTQGYAGVYGTAVKGPIAVDLQYRVEQTQFTANNEAVANGAGLGLNDAEFESNASTLSGAVSYSIPLENSELTFVPTAGFAFTQVSTDPITFEGTGVLEVQDFENQVGFVGATIARTKFGDDGVSAVNQFLTATVYNDFAENPVSVFTPDDGSGARNLTTENLGTYGELSAGLNYVRILQEGEFGAVRQFNAAVRADVRYSDQLESWGLTAQARLQF